MIVLKPQLPQADVRNQNSRKVSPSVSENKSEKSEHLDLEKDVSVQLKPTAKAGSGSSSRTGSASGKHEHANALEHDNLDVPLVSIHDLGRKGSGPRTVKVTIHPVVTLLQ